MAKIQDDRPVHPQGPFSRPLRITDVHEKKGAHRHIEANEAECAAIAQDAGLPAVKSLTGDFEIVRRAGGRFDVTGRIEAVITQICVVTLEPFDSTLAPEVEVSFALPPARGSREPNLKNVVVEFSDAAEDPPDLILDNAIDLGAVALEFLTLARDFYPKKPGVEFAGVATAGDDQPEPSSFAVLERFKDRS